MLAELPTPGTSRLADQIAHAARLNVLKMSHRAKTSHIGSCLSCIDILSVVYAGALRLDPEDPKWPLRDRFFLSKGHAAAALYAVLAESGFIPVEELDTYAMPGSRLLAHVSHKVPGIELSSGSLGHALSVATGIALWAKRRDHSVRSCVVLSDGELDEGSNWEAILFGGHHRLGKLSAIVDYNKIQSFGSTKEVLDLEPLVDKWRAFGWQVAEADGHDTAAMEHWFETSASAIKPQVLIAHTIKGKGVPFMEGRLEWHYRSPTTEQLARALAHLGTTRANRIR